jgi:hypothetical protein
MPKMLLRGWWMEQTMLWTALARCFKVATIGRHKNSQAVEQQDS